MNIHFAKFKEDFLTHCTYRLPIRTKKISKTRRAYKIIEKRFVVLDRVGIGSIILAPRPSCALLEIIKAAIKGSEYLQNVVGRLRREPESCNS
jgi:hypothetical protein